MTRAHPMILASLAFVFAGMAYGQSKTYHFSDDDGGSSAMTCCSAWMYYSDLDPKGMELGDVTLGLEDKAFFHAAKNGDALTKLPTSVAAKASGAVDIQYVFTCDKENNPECPDGHITIPFQMEVACGETKKQEYVYEYSWADLGVKLARMIINRPDVNKPLTGKAIVTLKDMKPCP